jgi:hypothetical protein
MFTDLKSIIWGLFFVLVMIAWIGHGCKSRIEQFRERREERQEERQQRWEDWREERQDRQGIFYRWRSHRDERWQQHQDNSEPINSTDA